MNKYSPFPNFRRADIAGRPMSMTGEPSFGDLGRMAKRSQLGSELEQSRSQLKLMPLRELRERTELQEYIGGSGLRGMQQQLGEAQTSISLAGIGDVGAAGQRAYTMGRETEELERLRMAGEGRRLQSQMAFQPQMEAIRGGIMGRMAGRLGVSLPAMGGAYQSGTGYTPSWMQNYQPPQFPRY